jgi:hypothetical protein
MTGRCHYCGGHGPLTEFEITYADRTVRVELCRLCGECELEEAADACPCDCPACHLRRTRNNQLHRCPRCGEMVRVAALVRVVWVRDGQPEQIDLCPTCASRAVVPMPPAELIHLLIDLTHPERN